MTKSQELFQRARECLPGGVPSGYQSRLPHPIYWERGSGSALWDVDGNCFVDFNLCLGATVVGHCNTDVAEAVSRAMNHQGSMLGGPNENCVIVAEELARRFKLPMWRFCNSGSAATRDAIQLCRAATRREKIVKIESGYHGMHESVCVSVWADLEEIGPYDSPNSVPSLTGVPKEMTDLTLIVPFNCPESLLSARLASDDVACVIMEPVMMNCGIIAPRPGFLEMVQRVCRHHGTLLVFDEVKSGLTLGPGGATAMFGVVPDLVTLGKALGGGTPVAAIGMTAHMAETHVVTGEPGTVSTFGGSALAMAAARATLRSVLTEEAYARMTALNQHLAEGVRRALSEVEDIVSGRVVTCGAAKGCIFFSASNTEKTQGADDVAVEQYRDVLQLGELHLELGDLMASVFAEEGVWLGAGDEEWTLSVAHTESDIERFVGAFRVFCSELRRGLSAEH